MSNLSPTEQALFNIAKASLPSCVFNDPTTDITPELAALSKIFAPIFDKLATDVQNTFILDSDDDALDQHAKDRESRRQAAESSEALRVRLRYLLDDTLTLTALRNRTISILDTYGVTLPDGYPGLVEMRRDRAFFNGGDGGEFLAVAAASITDGEHLVIGGLYYEFDKNASVTPGLIPIDISTAVTAADVAQAIVVAAQPRYGLAAYSSGDYAIIHGAYGASGSFVADGGFVFKRRHSYYSRGYRLSGASRGATTVVVILPYGTPFEAVASVAEGLRQIKAGGVRIIVERRLNP